MDYGKIIGETFGVIWKEKKLWLFAIIGLSLSALSTGLYMAWYFDWYGNFLSNLTGSAFPYSGNPEMIMRRMIGSMGWLFGGMSFMLCASLIGYIINLVMRGGSIAEADLAWQGESVDVGRGARRGASHGLHLFIIDLLWWVLPAVLVFGGMACGLLFMFGGIAAGESAGDETGAVFAMLGSMFAFFGVMACLGILIAVLQGIFSPLMYQATVLGGRSPGDAIKEGFSLARKNIGPMVIFLLVMFALHVGVQFIIQLASLPLMGGWMSSWFGLMMSMSEGATPQYAGPNAVLLFLGGMTVAAATLLGRSFSQTFGLTMYARVYRQLTAAEPAD